MKGRDENTEIEKGEELLATELQDIHCKFLQPFIKKAIDILEREKEKIIHEEK